MNKINFKILKERINNNYYDYGLETKITFDENMQMVLSFECFNSVSDDYNVFARLYEDGTFEMMYGVVNVLYDLENMDGLDQEAEDFDEYNELMDCIMGSLEQDIQDNVDYLNSIISAINMDMGEIIWE